MFANVLSRLTRRTRTWVQAFRKHISHWTKPATDSLILRTMADLLRSKPELVAENMLLRQQLIVLQRTVKRPRLTSTDRVILVLLASKVQAWREALVIIKPATVLCWHRQGFRLFWKWKSKVTSCAPKVPAETVALIQELAVNNRLWGAERIRGEVLKLGIRVSKRTVQKYMRQARPPRPSGQTWATFLHHHARHIWACDFLQVTDVCFRPIFAFFVTELASRRVVHVGVTRSPTDAWVAQQLREATPFGEGPKYLICDNDGKFGAHFANVAAGSGMTLLRTPYQAPRANAICERLLGSVRRECLDHLLIVSEAHLRRMLTEYVTYYNRMRPHQGIVQRVPDPPVPSVPGCKAPGKVIALPVLGGLHHGYCWAA